RPHCFPAMGAVRFLRRPPLFFFTKNIQMCKAPGNGRFFCWSWRSAGPEGEGGCFDSPSLPPLDSPPSRHDQGGALDPNAEGRFGRLAEKALYCASDVLRIAFSGQFSFGASCGRNSRMRTGAAL